MTKRRVRTTLERMTPGLSIRVRFLLRSKLLFKMRTLHRRSLLRPNQRMISELMTLGLSTLAKFHQRFELRSKVSAVLLLSLPSLQSLHNPLKPTATLEQTILDPTTPVRFQRRSASRSKVLPNRRRKSLQLRYQMRHRYLWK